MCSVKVVLSVEIGDKEIDPIVVGRGVTVSDAGDLDRPVRLLFATGLPRRSGSPREYHIRLFDLSLFEPQVLPIFSSKLLFVS
jgi:hypothetical protein